MSKRKSFPVPLTDIVKIFPKVTLVESLYVDVVIFSKLIITESRILQVHSMDGESFQNLFRTVCFTPIDMESKRNIWIYPRTIDTNSIEINTKHMIQQLAKKCKIVYMEYSSSINPKEIVDAINLT